MNNRRNKKNNPSSKREKAGFYIAFSLCLAAVGMSVWSAYTGVTNYFKENGDTSTTINQQDNTENVDKNLTDITEEDTESTTEVASDEEKTSETESVTQPEESSDAFVDNSEETDESEFTKDVMEEDIVQTILRVNKNLGYPTETKKIGKEFSEDMVFDNTMKDYRAHLGIDFVCEDGEKVISMCDATVDEVYYNEMQGNVVKVTSGEFSIFYCGLSDTVSVKAGDSITKGQEIGTALGVPCESADGTHIHVEIVVRNRHIDPLSVIENES